MCAQQCKQPQRQAAQRKTKTGVGLISSEQEPDSQPVPIQPLDE